MRIALICPSNILYMPYVERYNNILKEIDAEYDIINWDRFNIEESSEFVYRDSKVGHQRSFLDYYKYSQFISKRLDCIKYDKVIVFGIQLAFFLKQKLVKSLKNKYILDIRDYNKIITIFNIKKVVNHSSFTVISSPGFMEWLPKSDKYIINHNADINSFDDLEEVKAPLKDKSKINISYIGSLRDLNINIRIINSLKNNDEISLHFHGEGSINNKIEKYVKLNCINNVSVTGRYRKSDEGFFYQQSDIINIFVPSDDLNSRTLLPNRLYNAVIYGKPIVTMHGTYVANQIEKYELGIVLNSYSSIDRKLRQYIESFNLTQYKKHRSKFIEHVIIENRVFKNNVINFIKKDL